MAARPLASVLIESPGWTTIPVEPAWNAPPPCATVTEGTKTVNEAAALGEASAAVRSQKRPAPIIKRMTSRVMMSRYPPRRRGFCAVRPTVTDMAGTIPKGILELDLLGLSEPHALPHQRGFPLILYR